jgi:catechol 2,3-dioxygenase-like lactoylglutathione lyase family enzyme
MPSAGPARIVRAAPYLLVSDVARAGDYYQSVLGFEREYAAGEPPEFAIYSRDGHPIMLRRAPDPGRVVPVERQGGTELKQRGADFAYQLTVQQYGMRELAVRDLDGYVLGFGEPTG